MRPKRTAKTGSRVSGVSVWAGEGVGRGGMGTRPGVARGVAAQEEVLAHGEGEGDGGSLGDVGEALSAAAGRDRGDRNTVEEDSAGGGAEDAQQEAEECRF